MLEIRWFDESKSRVLLKSLLALQNYPEFGTCTLARIRPLIRLDNFLKQIFHRRENIHKGPAESAHKKEGNHVDHKDSHF